MIGVIYSDEGVSTFSLQECLSTFRPYFEKLTPIDHEGLLHTSWEKENHVLIIPGGRDIPYNRLLRGKGTEKISRFVKEGGSYLGICAGAYFATAEVIFEKGTPLEVHEKRELKFYPGCSRGTLYSHSPFSYDSEEGAHAADIDYLGKQIHLYYNGGCTFEGGGEKEGIEILARYSDVSHLPAIIHCQVGNGRAILSGVHFEVSPEGLKKEGSAVSLAEKIDETESLRKKLISQLMKILAP